MNILKRKGPRRLWIVSIVIWIICTIIISDYKIKANCWFKFEDGYFNNLNEICHDETVRFWWFMAGFIPVAVLIAFGLYGWIKRGFAEDK